MMKYFFTLLLAFITVSGFAQTASQPQVRVEPANWWIGMKHNEVEIMFHAPGIRDMVASIEKYKGVSIAKTFKMASPNYQIIRIRILASAQPGDVKFTFTAADSKQAPIKVNFPIRQRVSTPKAQGVNTSDAIYLVFPDRFSNGDPSNDNVAGMLQGLERDSLVGRHGGDLKGVENQLDYIKSLGMTTVWLNPELENDQDRESYHGYAVTDHYRVDRRFGDNDALVSLVKAAHGKGLKVVRDVVFNHIGLNHYWMKDLPDTNWVNKWPEFTRTSYRAPTLFDPYASKHDLTLFSDGWFDSRMPDLNQRHPRLGNYLLQQTIWWMEYAGFDDFRIDTYTYSDQLFSSWWCKEIRREYPNLNMFGEVWEHGVISQGYFADDQPMRKAEFDSNLPSMIDFQVNFAIKEMLTREQGWTEGAARLYYTLAQDFFYKDPNRNVIFLDNHDFTRFYTTIGESLSKYKSGVAMLATLRGIPQVYYATEILGTGNEWPSHGNIRKDFPGGWPGDKENKFTPTGRTAQENEAWDYMSKLFNYRKTSTTLQDGKLMQFVPADGLYVYFRYDSNGTILVAINTSGKEQKLDLKRFAERIGKNKAGTDIATGKTVILQDVVIPANSPIVLELD